MDLSIAMLAIIAFFVFVTGLLVWMIGRHLHRDFFAEWQERSANAVLNSFEDQ